MGSVHEWMASWKSWKRPALSRTVHPRAVLLSSVSGGAVGWRMGGEIGGGREEESERGADLGDTVTGEAIVLGDEGDGELQLRGNPRAGKWCTSRSLPWAI